MKTTTDNSFTAVAVTAMRAAMAVLADDLRGVRLGHLALSDAQVANAEAICQCLDDLDDLGYPGHPGAPEAEQRVRRFAYQPTPAFREQEFVAPTQW